MKVTPSGHPVEYYPKIICSYLAQSTSESGFDPERVTPSGHPVEVWWYFCRSTVRVQRAASLFNEVKNNFFLKYHLLLFLTYVFSLLTCYFSKDVRLSRPRQNFSRISFIQRFSGFPDLLLFPRMSGSVDLKKNVLPIFSKNIISYFSLLTYFPYLLATFFEGCQIELTSTFFFRISRIYSFTGFLRKK